MNLSPIVTIKVAGYITRQHAGVCQLLVFTDPAWADYGLVIPGGNVDDGESLEAGLRREIFEEAGRQDITVEALVASVPYISKDGRHNLRHYFHCTLERECPDQFDHTVTGQDGDRGAQIHYRWVDLLPSPPRLGGTLNDGLEALIEHLGTT